MRPLQVIVVGFLKVVWKTWCWPGVRIRTHVCASHRPGAAAGLGRLHSCARALHQKLQEPPSLACSTGAESLLHYISYPGSARMRG